MSRFCGKCDFADSISIHCDSVNIDPKDFDFGSYYEVYIHSADGRSHRLQINTYKDAVKYFPYIVSMSYGSAEKSVIVLSDTCYIDEEEKERIDYYLEDIKRIARKLKRKSIDITEENILKDLCYFGENPIAKTLVKRFIENKKDIRTDDLHIAMAEYYRNEWYNEMLKVGYDEFTARTWVYNWRRCYEDITK